MNLYFHNLIIFQIHVQKKNLEEYGRQTQNIQARIKRQKVEMENKMIKIKNCQKQIDDLKLTLKEISSQKMNIEERTRQLEKMLEVKNKIKNN